MDDDLAAKPRHPNQTPPAVTRRRQRAFLAALRMDGNITRAAAHHGLHPTQPHHWASKSESFAKKMREAKAKGEQALLERYERLIDSRSFAGKDDPASALLTMFRTKRLDPRYRDNATPITLTATGPVAISFGVDQSAPPTETPHAIDVTPLRGADTPTSSREPDHGEP